MNPKQIFEQLLVFTAPIHALALEKGFWVPKRNQGEMVEMMIVELSEATVSFQKNKFVNPEYNSFSKWQNEGSFLNEGMKIPQLRIEWFRSQIKDTFDDELADTVMYLLDYCHGFKKPLFYREYRKETTGNVPHDIMRLQWYVMNAFHEDNPSKDWGYALAAIIQLAIWHNVNLPYHVQIKLEYNKTRPFQHGKKHIS